jgi:hypothetical protein
MTDIVQVIGSNGGTQIEAVTKPTRRIEQYEVELES